MNIYKIYENIIKTSQIFGNFLEDFRLKYILKTVTEDTINQMVKKPEGN